LLEIQTNSGEIPHVLAPLQVRISEEFEWQDRERGRETRVGKHGAVDLGARCRFPV